MTLLKKGIMGKKKISSPGLRSWEKGSMKASKTKDQGERSHPLSSNEEAGKTKEVRGRDRFIPYVSLPPGKGKREKNKKGKRRKAWGGKTIETSQWP